jgi:rhamnose utilization protein RhaD (predicted bifunctional aldolase and dehydrogenase)/NAD(P)-dependent dehydrogenase (short-subunit alcohol dehydrogenase family)
MDSRWNDADADAAVEKYAKAGHGADMALRVYTTRLLGGDGRLVLHGGGNTSVKTTARDTLGRSVDVLCVKGSGWDMARIEPPGLPAVRLAPLLDLAALEKLSDEDMVNYQRLNLIDAAAPNPSIETLFHAWLPHKFIDHTHANAVVALTDQPNGLDLAREVYGARCTVVPYIMPGFGLAKEVKRRFEADPGVEGIVLEKHGIFSMGETAREAYERMIALVSLAEARLAKGRRNVFAVAALPRAVARAEDVAPILRGLLAEPTAPNEGAWKRWVADFRTDPAIRAFVDGADLARYSQQGTVTPDHVIRMKPKPLLLPAPEAGKLDAWKAAAKAAYAAYRDEYRAYFERHNPRFGGTKVELDRVPRVALVPGLGLFAFDKSAADARVVGDLAACFVDVVAAAEGIGTFRPVSEADLFDVEYWSLEQAKLGKGAEKPLARQVALVTGGGSGIGAATAAAFVREGAEIVVVDRDPDAAAAVAGRLKGLGLGGDVTDPVSVRAAFDAACRRFGGVDIVVSNAGAAWQGRIGDVDPAVLRESFELNFFAHQTVAQNAVRVFRAQGTGGCLLFNASKQAVNPGKDFGPYGLPKAATMFLSRQYALDHGGEGIRSNAVNADRVRSGLLTDAMVKSRAAARGVTEADYMGGNLLRREVRAEDVANAFVHLALSPKTTGAVLTVDGGNIEAALR